MLMSDKTKGWLGCLFYFIIFLIIIVLIQLYNDYQKKKESYYLVEETGYFHSTKNEDKCKFIKFAKEKGYTIKMIDKYVPIEKDYHICNECFTHNEQEKYIKDYKFSKISNLHESDISKWEQLSAYLPCNFNELYVYLDTLNILHIDGNCLYCTIEGGRVTRYSFSEIDSISSTCGDCVKRKYCDFIYKKIYEGVYDIKAIKDDIDDENDIDDDGH